MVQQENVMVLMKRFLTTMNRRLDDLAAKTSQLEEELGRIVERHDSENVGLHEKVTELSSNLEGALKGIDEAKEDLRKGAEKIDSELEGYASLEAINELQSRMEKDVETLRDEKLDRTDFHEFVDSYSAPLKELFDEKGSESFAEYARAQSSYQGKPSPVASEAPEPEAYPVEIPSPADQPAPLEEKRPEKKKKKWL